MKTVFVTTNVTDFKSTDVEGVGTLRFIKDKRYKWVRNSTGGALTLGGFYTYGFANTTGYNFGEEIFSFGQASKQTTIDFGAGVATSAIPDGQFGWIQTHGLNTDALVESTTDVAQGDSLKLVTGQIYVVKDVAVATVAGANESVKSLVAKTADSAAASSVWLNFN